MKVFVTGASGFIGSHFVNQAHTRGIEIVAQRRSAESKPRVPLLSQPQWIDCQLDQLSREHFVGCDALVHLASHTPNPPYDSFVNCLYWNVTATTQMFESAGNAGLKRWVVAGSSFEYGKSGERYAFIPNDAPLEPTSSYPASKAAASIVLSGLAIEAGASLLIGRIFQVYGDGEQDSRFWPSLKRAALSGLDFPMTMGDQVRDFVPVEQVAKYFVDALFRTDLENVGVKTENVGSGHPQSLREFAEFWWTTWNAQGTLLLGQISYRPNEIMRYVPSL